MRDIIFKKVMGTNWNYYISGDVKIGKDCHIGVNVHFCAVNPNKFKTWKDDFNCPTEETIVIEDECFIGSNCVILSGVHVGKHTIIGAGSIVTCSFPNGYCVIAGNPARKIGELFTNDNGRDKTKRSEKGVSVSSH